MTTIELQQAIDGLRRENHELNRIIERARSYSGKEGWTCPLCRNDGIFFKRCGPHERLHKAFQQMIDAYERLRAGDYDGARDLLDSVTRYHRAPEHVDE